MPGQSGISKEHHPEEALLKHMPLITNSSHATSLQGKHEYLPWSRVNERDSMQGLQNMWSTALTTSTSQIMDIPKEL